jgi:hypothetical protein
VTRTTAALIFSIVATTTACSDSNDSQSAPTPLPDQYELSSDDSVPEGVTFDPQTRQFYATSLQGGSIVRPNADFSAGNVVTVAQRSGLSTATVVESRLYVIKSDVLHFFLNQTLDTLFEIFRVDLNAFDQE